MKKFRHFFIVGFIVVILIIAGLVLDRFFPTKQIQSAVTDNVSGWAWSETVGWISFNNTSGGGQTTGGPKEKAEEKEKVKKVEKKEKIQLEEIDKKLDEILGV